MSGSFGADPSPPRGGGRASRAGRAGALAAVALAAALAVSADGEAGGAAPDRAGAALGLDAGWTRLPRPPEVRDGAAFVWDGSRLLAWGGCDPEVSRRCAPTSSGYALGPSQRSWTRLPRAPERGAYADAVWTGAEAIFLSHQRRRLIGQALDPFTGSWRALPTLRVGGVEVVPAWTGSELVVWGGGGRRHPHRTVGAAYDPASDSWHPIAEAPISLNAFDAVWTGSEVMIFGSLLDRRNRAATRTAIGAAYDPALDSWRRIARSALSPQASSAAWAGGRLIAWDYETRWQAYRPHVDRWRETGPMPFPFDECYPDSTRVGNRVFAFFCGRAALYGPASRRWRRIHGGPLDDKVRGGYKRWRFADLVPASDTVYLAMQGITVTRHGVVCFGCPGSPASYWAYRP